MDTVKSPLRLDGGLGRWLGYDMDTIRMRC